MSKDYIEQPDSFFLQQLIAFETNLPAYADNLGFDDSALSSVTADRKYFAYIIACIEIVRNSATQWTAYRDDLRDGGSPTGGEAKAPVFPATPEIVPPGIEPRFRALANRIKTHPGYTEAIGKALGIVREAPAPLDLTSVKPTLAAKRDGSDVRVLWGWGSNRGPLQMCEIHVDRNDGKGSVLLTFDTTPNYLDTHEQPAAPVQWTYKAIYRSNDRQVGQWSDPVTVTAGG